MPRTKHTTPAAPTSRNYAAFQIAFDHFNAALFDGQLPPALITFQRKKNSMGYFSPERFKERVGKGTVSEIALNPTYFATKPPIEICQTLVHEQAHQWQMHFGKPSRTGYHNKEWAAKMEEIGLMPSSTGQPGGRKVGQKMADYVIPGGRFEQAAKELMARGDYAPYVEHGMYSDDDASEAKEKKKKDSKQKYSCETCGFNVWAKPDAHIICGDCFANDGDATPMLWCA